MPNISKLIERYKIPKLVTEDSIVRADWKVDLSLPLVAEVTIRKNRSFEQFLDSTANFTADPKNIYKTKEQIISWSLAKDQNFGNLSQMSTCYSNNMLVLFAQPSSDPEYYKRDLIHTTIELTSAAIGYLTKLRNFDNPKLNIQYLQPPAHSELIHIHRYYQMIWFAGLRRMIGEDVLGIPASDKTHTPMQLQKEFVKIPNFTWDLLPEYRKYGHTIVRGQTKAINFCKDTKGDLY